jgi:hypothetical protein
MRRNEECVKPLVGKSQDTRDDVRNLAVAVKIMTIIIMDLTEYVMKV